MYIFKSICMFLYVCVIFASAQDEDSTVEIVTIETTTQEVIIVTDLSQDVVDEALKIEVGEYTTMVYNYINAQFSRLSPIESCFDEYIKCYVTKGISMPVCVIRDTPDGIGVHTFPSYCEAYLENCRLGERYWYILEYGFCQHRIESSGDIRATRRRLGLLLEPWNFIFTK